MKKNIQSRNQIINKKITSGERNASDADAFKLTKHMMKKILVPTCFTLQSLNAIVFALKLFKHQPCDFILLHVNPLPSSITDLLLLPREEEKLERVDLVFEQAMARLQREYAVEINSLKIIHKYGDLADTVKEYVGKNNIDLVLYPESDVLKGSAVRRYKHLIEGCPCPALFVPKDFDNRRPSRIAYLVDSKDQEQLATSKLIKDITSLGDVQLMLLCVIKSESEIHKFSSILSMIFSQEEVSETNYTVHFIKNRHFKEGFHEVVKEFNIDMLFTGISTNMEAWLGLKQAKTEVIAGARVPFLAIAG
jgi:hypothetical protein